MEYFLIIILQSLGIGFHVMQKVISLGDKFPAETPRSVFKLFWKEDWDTLVVSGLILVLNIVGHYITFDKLGMVLLSEWYWQIAPYVLSLVGGYLGQRWIYKFFGSAEKALDKQFLNKLDNLG